MWVGPAFHVRASQGSFWVLQSSPRGRGYSVVRRFWGSDSGSSDGRQGDLGAWSPGDTHLPKGFEETWGHGLQVTWHPLVWSLTDSALLLSVLSDPEESDPSSSRMRSRVPANGFVRARGKQDHCEVWCFVDVQGLCRTLRMILRARRTGSSSSLSMEARAILLPPVPFLGGGAVGPPSSGHLGVLWPGAPLWRLGA